MALLEILTICSLISISPYYDCSNEWEIRIYDNFPDVQCKKMQREQVILGCAKTTDTIHMIYAPDFRDGSGMTILEHELMHLRCECIFH